MARLTWDVGICHQQAIGCNAQETPTGGLQDDFATIPVHTEEGVRFQGVPVSYDGSVAPLERMWGPGGRLTTSAFSPSILVLGPIPIFSLSPASVIFWTMPSKISF